MENETAPATKKSSMMPVAIVVTIVVIILVGAIGFAMTNKPKDSAPGAAMEQAPSPTVSAPATTEEAMIATYKDGEYSAEGMYTSPGGEESIDVTLTLKDGIVEDAEVVSNAVRPISKQMQTAFIGGFKEQVIGKNIDELNLTKVSSSSLSPKGFNDAVEKIKIEAKA